MACRTQPAHVLREGIRAGSTRRVCIEARAGTCAAGCVWWRVGTGRLTSRPPSGDTPHSRIPAHSHTHTRTPALSLTHTRTLRPLPHRPIPPTPSSPPGWRR